MSTNVSGQCAQSRRASILAIITVLVLGLSGCFGPVAPGGGDEADVEDSGGSGSVPFLPSTVHLYVDDDASSTGADGSKSAPFPTIQEAVDAAVAGDVIAVADGSYGQVTITGPVSLYGGYAADFSSRTPFPSGSVVSFAGGASTSTIEIDGSSSVDPVGRSSVLDGFTIRHSGTGTRYALSIDAADPTVSNNVIETTGASSTMSTQAYGIYAFDSEALITGNEIRGRHDSAGDAHGFYVSGSGGGEIELVDNYLSGVDAPGLDGQGYGFRLEGDWSARLVGNTITAGDVAQNSGGVTYAILAQSSGTLELYNNVISGGTFGGAASSSYALRLNNDASTLRAYNNTFYAGDAGSSFADLQGLRLDATDITLVNNIFGRGTALSNNFYLVSINTATTITLENNAYYEEDGAVDDLHRVLGSTYSTEADLNDASKSVAGLGAAGGNLIIDPVFVDDPAGDFRLTVGSPAAVADGGQDVTSVDPALSTDRAGNPRPGSDGQWSIGAYEAP